MRPSRSNVLLVAGDGGHLKELHRLAPRLLSPGDHAVWVTNRSLQSSSLLRGERIVFVPGFPPRDGPATLVSTLRAVGVLVTHRPRQVISTGPRIALSFLPLARAFGADCHYIESATRVHSPSLTGRLLRWVPGVRCYTQHLSASDDRVWRYAGSVFEGFRVRAVPTGSSRIRRVVVILGTWTQGFSRLVERLRPLLPPSVESLWQTGFTDVRGLSIASRPWLPPDDLATALRNADVVVTHAGVGATLDALEAGRCPVIVPRRQATGEQIDDHQVELAKELDRQGLAIARLPEQLRWDDLLEAASREVHAEPLASLGPVNLERPNRLGASLLRPSPPDVNETSSCP